MSEDGDDYSSERRRVAEDEATLVEAKKRVEELREELNVAPRGRSAEQRAAAMRKADSVARMRCLALLASSALIVFVYFKWILPSSNFDENAERRLSTYISETRTRAADLDTALPEAQRELAEHNASLVTGSKRAGPDDFLCLTDALRAARVERESNELAMRWAQIALAACRTKQLSLGVSALRVLNQIGRSSLVPDGGTSDASTLSVHVAMMCRREHHVDVLSGLILRSHPLRALPE